MLLKNFMQNELQVKKGSVKIPIKGLIDQYRERYEEMSQDTSRPFHHTVYRTTPGNRIIIHVKVPSRSLSKFYYDILLEIDPTDKAASIEDCNIRFFSNSPSFVYTYAYVFYHLDPDQGEPNPKQKRKLKTGMIIDTFTRKIPKDRLLMPGTEKKLGNQPLHQEPSTRNPLGLPYLDSSLYLAIFYLEDVTTLPEILSQKNYRTEAQIFNAIPTFDKLMAERTKLAKKEREAAAKKRKDEEKSIRTTETTVRKANSIRGIKQLSHTLKPQSAKRVQGVKKPKHVGR